jgi:L-amino acid N-acyltransferase YncA
MLDYTLVSAKATYRMLEQPDVRSFLALVGARHRDDPPGWSLPQEKILATFRELQRNKDRGTLFVFEQGLVLVGYAILINFWSNRLGGLAVVVDEMYVDPDRGDPGLPADFLQLLAKVAPAEVRAIRVAADARDRRSLGELKRLGFRDSGRTFFELPVKNS